MREDYVGILLNSKSYQGIPRGLKTFEALRNYELARERYRITPCFIQLNHLQPQSHDVLAYVKDQYGYKERRIPMPRVMHNRLILLQDESKQRLQRIAEQGVIVYNACNRYSKWEIHQLLIRHPLLKSVLPYTVMASPLALYDAMTYFDVLILKPCNSSIGRGVMKLSKMGSQWKLQYPTKVNQKKMKCVYFNHNQVPPLLLSRLTEESYLIQEYIDLATYNGRTFDIRVSVQKNSFGTWQVTGMVGKVAAKDKVVTNLAKGGQAFSLDHLLECKYPYLNHIEIKQKITELSLAVVSELANSLAHLADVGLDIGMTPKGKLFFIECNGRDLRYSFRKAGQLEIWENTFLTPMGYAKYLMNN